MSRKSIFFDFRSKAPYNMHIYAHCQLYIYEGSVQHAHICTLSVIHVRRVRTSRKSIFFDFRSKAPYNRHIYAHCQLYMYEGSVQYVYTYMSIRIHIHIAAYTCLKGPYNMYIHICVYVYIYTLPLIHA